MTRILLILDYLQLFLNFYSIPLLQHLSSAVLYDHLPSNEGIPKIAGIRSIDFSSYSILFLVINRLSGDKKETWTNTSSLSFQSTFVLDCFV